MSDKPKIDLRKLEEYSNDSWFVLTPENTEFGPFAWKDLLVFVKQLRLTAVHKLKHPSKTKGKWFAVSEFAELLSQIPTPEIAQNATKTEPPRVDLSQLARSSSSAKRSSIFADVLLGLVDFQFKHYVTPSIIRFTWIVLLGLTIASLCWTVYGLILAAETQVLMNVVTKNFPREDPAFRVPVQPIRPQFFGFGYVLFASFSCVVSFVALLWVRVLMECIIVIFDISNNIKSLLTLHH